MSDLVEFLRARLDEDEQRAHACGPVPWVNTVPCAVHVDPAAIRDNKLAYGHLGYVAGTHRGELGDAYRAHIARHDPARVLAEVDAKRRIIELHSSPHTVVDGFCVEEGGPCTHVGENFCQIEGSDDCPTLRLLALPDADHPDYRQEWKP